MPNITGPWTYLTPQVTIDYGDGTHDVSAEIAAAFAAEKKEVTNGDQGPAKAGAARGDGKA